MLFIVPPPSPHTSIGWLGVSRELKNNLPPHLILKVIGKQNKWCAENSFVIPQSKMAAESVYGSQCRKSNKAMVLGHQKLVVNFILVELKL